MNRRHFLRCAGLSLLSAASGACARPQGGSGLSSPAFDPGRLLYTFDDAPLDLEETIVLADMLRLNAAPAQFYFTGDAIKQRPASVEYLIAEDFHVGWHSMRHERMSHKTDQQLARDIRQWRKVMRGVVPAYEPELARFPYGDGRHEQVPVLAQEGLHIQPCSWGGFQPCNWDVDTWDWHPYRRLNRNQIFDCAAHAMSQNPGADIIILLHLNLAHPVRFDRRTGAMTDSGDLTVTTSTIMDDLDEFETLLI